MLRDMFDDARGSISVLSALTIVAVIGFSALALEFGNGLLQRVENQRIADIAAYGGALFYNSTGSTSSTSSAVGNIAALNGLSSTAANSSVVSSPTSDGNNAVKVTVTTNVPLYLAQLIRANTTMGVSATAYAEVNASAPGCIIALKNSGSGISLSGGTSITANNCAVASNNAVTLVGGTKITTKNLDYSTSYSVSGGSSIVPPSGTSSVTYSKTTTTDPLSSNSEVTGATSRISSVASIASPSVSVTVPSSSTTTSFTKTGVTGLPGACSDTYNSSTKIYTVTCSGTATFGTITVSNVTVTLNTSSGNTYNFNQAWPISGVTLAGSGGIYGFGAGLTTSGTTNLPAGTYNVVGSITLGGTTTFGAGTYNVTTGITAGGGSTTTFGSGTFNLGASNSITCGNKGPAKESICNTGTSLTFDGPSTFVLSGGIYNGGGASLTLGSGSTSNSYNIGKAGDGNSINAGTSQSLILDDASGSGDIFQTAGNITSGGGSSLVLPAAAEHDINGNIDLSGNATLGAGIYTINGYFAIGASAGGTTFTALGVTMVVSGTSTVTCNGVASSAFCLGAGYSTVKLTAPTSTSTLGSGTAGLAVIGPQSSSNTSVAAFTTGATNTQVSGAFYFPNGQVTMSGAATLHDTVDSGACLELIGSQVTLSGGSATGSTCAGLGTGSTGTTVNLVQ